MDAILEKSSSTTSFTPSFLILLIEFVLDKYPYEDYEEDKRLNKIDFSKEQELLLYLSSKYHPDQYKYMNEEEQIQKLHFIAELIDSLLNNMYNTIQ